MSEGWIGVLVFALYAVVLDWMLGGWPFSTLIEREIKRWRRWSR